MGHFLSLKIFCLEVLPSIKFVATIQNRYCIFSWGHLNSARLSSSKYGRDRRNPRAQDRGSPGAFSLPSLNILIVRLLWIEHLDHSPPILLVVDDVN